VRAPVASSYLPGGRSALPVEAADPVQYYHGAPQVNDEVLTEIAAARTEILVARPEGACQSSLHLSALEAVRRNADRGVAMRLLYRHATRFDETTKSYVRAVSEYGVEVRTLAELFDTVIVIDRTVAFVAASPQRTSVARVSDPTVVRFMVDVFERSWDRAEFSPFQPTRAADAAPEIVPGIHQTVQRLLIEGHPDVMIARRLGISVRSLQNHISRIKQQLGAKNRVHLGFLLGRFHASSGAVDADGSGSAGEARRGT
jgi:DNA-binding CsgD family transcriptional regulator